MVPLWFLGVLLNHVWYDDFPDIFSRKWSNFFKRMVTLFWTFKVPWGWAYSATGIPEWIVQFAFGFYSMMLTSTLIGLIVMVLYKPRTWCAFCPMGTMTQGVCQLRAAGEQK